MIQLRSKVPLYTLSAVAMSKQKPSVGRSINLYGSLLPTTGPLDHPLALVSGIHVQIHRNFYPAFLLSPKDTPLRHLSLSQLIIEWSIAFTESYPGYDSVHSTLPRFSQNSSHRASAHTAAVLLEPQRSYWLQNLRYRTMIRLKYLYVCSRN